MVRIRLPPAGSPVRTDFRGRTHLCRFVLMPTGSFRNPVLSLRNRKFESISLQRGVRCELDTLGRGRVRGRSVWRRRGDPLPLRLNSQGLPLLGMRIRVLDLVTKQPLLSR